MTSNTIYRVVLDTNTIIGAGSRWLAREPRRPVSLLQQIVFAVASAHVGLYCQKILDEYVELMVRRNHPPDRVALFVAYIIELFTSVNITSETCHTVPGDPDDVIVILCALDGDADLLVSEDKHLLDIRNAYHPRPTILRAGDAAAKLLQAGVPTGIAEGKSA